MIPYYEKYVKIILHPVKKSLKKGFKKEVIESKLREKHWPEDIINEAFKHVLEDFNKQKKKLTLNILYWLGLAIAVSSFLFQDYFIYLIGIGILLMLLSVPMRISERRELRAVEQVKLIPLKPMIPATMPKQAGERKSFFSRLFSRKPKVEKKKEEIKKEEISKKEEKKPVEKKLVVKKTKPKNPILALFLSLIIPGLGQIYNGQAKKGIIILLTFYLIVPWIYGIIDAYKTANEINKHITPPEIKPGEIKKEEKKLKKSIIARIILLLLALLLIAVNYIGFAGLYGFSTTNSISYSIIILILMIIIFAVSRKRNLAGKKKEEKEERVQKVELEILRKEVNKRQEGNETDFDRLHKLVEKYGRIKLSDVAETFKITKKEAEEWATILEHHNLASIYYPAVGGPEIIRVKKRQKTEEEEEENA